MSMLLIDNPMKTPNPNYQHGIHGLPIMSYHGWGGRLIPNSRAYLQPSAVILMHVPAKHGVMAVWCDVVVQNEVIT